MYPKPFEYTRATSVEHAIQVLKENEGSRVIAGGQSLLPMLKARLYQPVMLVDINFIPELRAVELNEKGELVIGAMVTHFDVIENSLDRRRHIHVELRQLFGGFAGSALPQTVKGRVVCSS